MLLEKRRTFDAFLKNKKIQIFSVSLSIVGLVLVIGFLNYCKEKVTHETYPEKSDLEGITFFNIGENTSLLDEIRDQLRKKLGPDAVEKRNTMDLTVNYKGF